VSTVIGLVVGLILAFPLTWAMQGIYGALGGPARDPSAVSATDMRLIIVIVLLALNLFRDGRRSPPMRGR
jgi:hypothetical protein